MKFRYFVWQLFFLHAIMFLSSIAIGQNCDCCKLRSSGQKKYNSGDWKGARSTWQNAQKMPDAINCPDLTKLLWKTRDNDLDGIINGLDKCPNVFGPSTNNGCPVPKPLDIDEDGTPDFQDECPKDYGLKRFKGCPDADGDGIPDYQDLCPVTFGSINARGCSDRDSDGVPDIIDYCPDDPISPSLIKTTGFAFGCPKNKQLHSCDYTTIEAREGDTVKSICQRLDVNPVVIALLNGVNIEEKLKRGRSIWIVYYNLKD